MLLILPPFTQSNTPYPSTAYLVGYLGRQGIAANQVDLGIETLLRIFSRKGLQELFAEAERMQEIHKLSKTARRTLRRSEDYLRTIEPTVRFLQGKEDILAYRLADTDYLPKGKHFAMDEEELEWAFGIVGTRDKARHMASLYLDDLSEFIQETVDPHFGFSRYAEHLGRCASHFDEIQQAMDAPLSFTDRVMLDIFRERMEQFRPKILGLSVPFPGNLYSALRCAAWCREHAPQTVITMGGGFPSTELRSISDPRFFHYVDFLTMDDGEDPMRMLHAHVMGQASKAQLVRTFCLNDTKDAVVYHDDTSLPPCPQSETGFPDYRGLDLKCYLSIIEVANPMHKLWSDGRWNKMTLAHGCYWGRCAFCDTSLDYIKRYAPNKAQTIVDRMEQLIAETGDSGFHFVDEAAPPNLLREMAREIIRRGLTVVWWGNIRFEKSFSQELCTLLRESGCIAVSGGLEVASPRLLKLINKGVSVPQVAQVAANFTEANILVHAYLMYGFPTQTAQETIDSLEVVRQLFGLGLVQSGFWHRFAMTAHSPVGLNPDTYACHLTDEDFGGFAQNDLNFEENTPTCPHEEFSEGLRISLYNYMNGAGFDIPLAKWFPNIKTPRTTLPPNYLEQLLYQNHPTHKRKH